MRSLHLYFTALTSLYSFRAREPGRAEIVKSFGCGKKEGVCMVCLRIVCKGGFWDQDEHTITGGVLLIMPG